MEYRSRTTMSTQEPANGVAAFGALVWVLSLLWAWKKETSPVSLTLCLTIGGVVLCCLQRRTEVVAGGSSGIPKANGGYPVIGHALAQFQKPRGEAFAFMAKSTPNDGLIRFREIWGQHSILLTSPKALSDVLVHNSYAYTKPPAAQKLFSVLFGRSLLVAEGDEHRTTRKVLQPLFSYRKVQDMYESLWSKALDMTQALLHDPAAAAGEPWATDISVWCNKGMMDAIGLVALGVDFDTLKQPHELVDLFATMTSTDKEVQGTFVANALLPSWVLRLVSGLGPFKRLAQTGQRLRSVLHGIIEEAKEKPENYSRNSVLLGAIRTSAFTSSELVDQFLLIIGAGHEPTAAAFAWAVWLLATHQGWQSKLRDELRSNIPDQCLHAEGGHRLAPECLDSLPVLNAVISETLRYRPTTPFTTRVAQQDTVVCGQPIPQGTRIYISPYVTNRSEYLYGLTAESFDPGRWIEESGRLNNNGGAASNYAFITFLHGPRKCIGDTIAKAELRTFLAAFVYRFEFEMEVPNEIPKPIGVLATKPENGLNIKLQVAS